MAILSDGSKTEILEALTKLAHDEGYDIESDPYHVFGYVMEKWVAGELCNLEGVIIGHQNTLDYLAQKQAEEQQNKLNDLKSQLEAAGYTVTED